MPPKKFFKLITGEKRKNSSNGNETHNIKRAKHVYEFDKSSSSEVPEADETFDDSGLADSESSTFLFDDFDERFSRNDCMGLLNKSHSSSKNTYQRSPLARNCLNVMTSTPLKVRRNNKSKEKVDLWEKAMTEDPNLRSWIEQFNKEINSVENSELVIKEKADN